MKFQHNASVEVQKKDKAIEGVELYGLMYHTFATW